MICKHYSHWMYSIESDTNTVVKCRLCYEEMTGRQFNRFSVKKMKCAFCYCTQPVNSLCQNSECTMFLKKHKYYCDICHLWDNKPQKNDYNGKPSNLKPIYHCSDCGICRVGNPYFYRHCKKCNMCVPTKRDFNNKTHDNHSCWGTMKENPCPICYTDIFQSNSPATFLRCGHAIHQECMNEYLKHGGYKCPTCKHPIVDIPTVPIETIHNLIHSLEEEENH